MDVFGKQPTDPKGEYFRNNVWWWHPLWDYCLRVAPSLAGKVKYGHENSGDGLDASDALALAEVLDREIKSGRTAAYALAYERELEALPDEPPPRVGPGDQPCNGCHGKGVVRPWVTHYAFSVENVEEWVELRYCGGFEIC